MPPGYVYPSIVNKVRDRHFKGGVMMKYTSAEAAKLLRKLMEEYSSLTDRELRTNVFTVSIDENPEEVRPSYDFKAVQVKLSDIERKIRILKHAMNQFNVSTVVDGFDMTIDQMLVYIPQLNERKKKLAMMASRLPKERAVSYSRNAIVEYTYANYSIEDAEAELEKVSEELSKAQIALDVTNNSVQFEIDLD